MPPRSSADREDHNFGFDASITDMKEQRTPVETPSARSVRFAPTAKVRQVVKMTKEQAKDIWFVNEDFAKMKKSFAPTVQRMMDGSLTEEERKGEEHCTRGLEYRTKEGARHRLRNKHVGMAAVLQEQDRQAFEEMKDPVQLAVVYGRVGAKCMEEAIALGEQDALDVQDYIAQEEENAEPEDEVVEEESSSHRPLRRTTSRGRSMRQKPRASGSFHERTIKGIRRVLSGGKNRRRNTLASV